MVLKHKKRVCLFATNYDFTRQKLVDYYERLLGQDFELFLYCEGENVEKFKVKNIKKGGFNGKRSSIWKGLRAFCRKNDIDVALGFSGGGTVSATMVLATLFTKTKYLAQIHGNFLWRVSDIRRLGLAKYALQYNLRNSFFFVSQLFMDKMLVCAEDITKKFKKRFFLGREKIHFLPSAIDTSLYRIKKDREKIRKKLGFKKNENVVISVGRVSYLKGSDLLYEVIKKNQDKTFVLLGHIDDQRFKKEKLSNVINTTALGEKLVDYYNAADLGIFLSRTEGNPFGVREVMASGVPTIVLNIESVRLIEPAIKVSTNTDEINSQVKQFFKRTRKQMKDLGVKSREFVVKTSSFDSLRKRYVELFND